MTTDEEMQMLTAPGNTEIMSKCRLFSFVAGLFSVCVGIAVLLGGWACGIGSLKTVLPGYAAMAPNTAIGLILIGAVISCDRGGKASATRVAFVQVCAGAVGVIGGLTLIEYLFGVNLRIDELLFANPAKFLSPPARMAAVTATSFTLFGGGLAFSRNRRGFMVGQYLLLAAGVLPLFNTIAFLYGVKSFYKTAFAMRAGTTMAIHTAVLLSLLCAAALLSRPDRGLMSMVTSDGPGGVLSRRLLPGAVFIPCVFGWLRWQGQTYGLYDTAFGLTLLTAINVIAFSILIWRSGAKLNILDAVRARAQREAREIEMALAKSEASFEELADSMPQMVWTSTADGSIDYYNKRWYDYTGTTFEQSKNWGWGPVLHPDDVQNTMDRWTEAFTTCGPYEIEYRFLRASDNVYRWHLGRASAIRNSEGAVVRWFGTCTDIEEYKQAETKIRTLNEGLEERVRERTQELDGTNRQLAKANEDLQCSALRLEQSNRELQDFASVASHDLQEPLRKVQAFGDRLMVRSREGLDDQGRDYLDRMLNATKRMQSLIQDLLRFARVTSQGMPFLRVDLTRVTRDVLSDLEVRISETGAQVIVSDLPTIDADAPQMRQLLQNLIGNALKFHQKGKSPIVRVFAEEGGLGRTADGMFQLVVEDQGIGFDEKHRDRIFNVFQRLHARSEYEGTGIGLSICRKIAQRHGGDITAKSTPGEGASFAVTLPLLHSNQVGPLFLPEPALAASTLSTL